MSLPNSKPDSSGLELSKVIGISHHDICQKQLSNIKDNSEEAKLKKIREEIVKTYIALMFTFLPLYYSDNYYNILHDKRDVYVSFTIAFLIVIVLFGVIQIIMTRGKIIKDLIKEETKSICLLDIVMLLFAIATVISTCLSGDRAASFTGENAWDVGSGVILLATAMYFAVSRLFSRRADIWFYIYVGSFAVLMIGIIDRLGYDFLIMHDEIPLQYEIFISTIGNVNFWSGYLSMLVPIFALAPIFMKSRITRFFSYIYVFAAYFSCFITLSNTTYIGIGCGMAYIVYCSLRDRNHLKNLGANMILFMLAGMLANIFWKRQITPRAIDTDTISLLLLEYKLYYIVGAAGVLLLLYALLAKGEHEKGYRIARYAWIGILVFALGGVVAYMVFNYSLELFNYRGSIWYFSWMGYISGSVKDIIIGAGPGLLDTVTQAQIAKADFTVVWDYLYDTAHNDVLEYLVTTGAVGAVLRLAMYVIPFVMTAKKKTDKPCEYQAEKEAVLAGLVGFIGQGLMVGPYIFTYAIYAILLGMFKAYDRKQSVK